MIIQPEINVQLDTEQNPFYIPLLLIIFVFYSFLERRL